MKRRPPPEVCPVCGEDVPRSALACPECGADERSGWRADADEINGLGLDDDGFDYDDFVAREFGGGSPRPRGIRPIWWITAIILLAAFLLWVLYVP